MKNGNVISAFSYASESDLNVSEWKKIIRLSSKGFCIAVFSEKKAERLFQYSFTRDDLSVEDKLETIRAINQELKIDCKNNFFRLYTQFNVQIPNEFYAQENDKTVLSLIVESPENYVPFAEKADDWGLYSVSAWEKDLYICVKKIFPDYELGTVLSSLLPVMAQLKEGKKTLIFVGDHNFTIAAADGQKLLGVNTFPFSDENDFLYYSFAFVRKMYPNTESISIKLCGNIAPKSPLYAVLNKYFSDVDMVPSSCRCLLVHFTTN